MLYDEDHILWGARRRKKIRNDTDEIIATLAKNKWLRYALIVALSLAAIVAICS